MVLTSLFAMAEIALLSARKTRLEIQANKGDAQARAALNLANHPDTFLSTVQIGITLMSILIGLFSDSKAKADLIVFFSQFEFLKNYSNTAATTVVVIILPIWRW